MEPHLGQHLLWIGCFLAQAGNNAAKINSLHDDCAFFKPTYVKTFFPLPALLSVMTILVSTFLFCTITVVFDQFLSIKAVIHVARFLPIVFYFLCLL